MQKKEIGKVLNTLIGESRVREKQKDLSRISTLNIPVETSDGELYTVDVNAVAVFDGIENIVSRLLEEVQDACFLGQTDVSVTVNIERSVCRQLYDSGIQKIFFYSAIENMEELPSLYGDIAHQLRYIFNALQSAGINKGFFEKSADENFSGALLFPFNREVASDRTRLHYLVERSAGSHFLRITAEATEHSRLHFRKINHRVISNIELIDDYFNLRLEALTLYSSVVNRCREGKLTYKDPGLQFQNLIHFFRKAGYEEIKEITVNWPRSVIDAIVIQTDSDWFGNLIRLLLIVSDSTTISLLASGKTISTHFAGTVIFLSLTQRRRSLQIDLQKKTKTAGLDEYLAKMERLQSAAAQQTRTLEKVHVVFIHHFTNETLAVLGAFDRLGVRAADTLWVKYSGNIPARYLETIFSLPASVYRFFGLQQITGKDGKISFCLSDYYSPIDALPDLQAMLQKGSYEFFDAMQCAAMHLFLNAAAVQQEECKIIIAEDGGYLAPLVNRLALEGLRVKEVFDLFHYDNPSVTHNDAELPFYDWIKPRFLGSVEHTRNGYDALKAVETQFSMLAFPACSLAVSQYKVNNESIEVACSCLNAVENILAGQGFALNSRRCLVLGSLGAVGRQTMKILSYRLGSGSLAGIDVKYNESQKYEWMQTASPSGLPDEFKYSCDLIFGATGRSILDAAYFEDLLINTKCRTIFLASGSTKRFEFIEFIDWTESLLKNDSPVVNGFPARITANVIEDPQTSSLQGTIFSFEIEKESRTKQVDICLLSGGMPVNFQYYGVPRETMDSVMTELVSLVNIVAYDRTLPGRVLALDHEIDIRGKLLERYLRPDELPIVER